MVGLADQPTPSGATQSWLVWQTNQPPYHAAGPESPSPKEETGAALTEACAQPALPARRSPACTCHSHPLRKHIFVLLPLARSAPIFRESSPHFSAAQAAYPFPACQQHKRTRVVVADSSRVCRDHCRVRLLHGLKRDTSSPCVAAASPDFPCESAAPGVTRRGGIFEDLMQQLLMPMVCSCRQVLVAARHVLYSQSLPPGELK